MSLYKSTVWKERIQTAHLKRLEALPFKIKRYRRDTSFGTTHIAEAGNGIVNEDSLPVLALHGVHAGAGIALQFLDEVALRRKIYAPDTIGQATLSDEKKMDLKDGSYGKWLAELIENLGLRKVDIIAASYGGFLLADLLRVAPEKVNKAIFLVPAGFANGGFWESMKKLTLPMMRFKKKSDDDSLREFLSAFYSEMNIEDLEFQRSLQEGINLDLRRPPLASANEFRNFKGNAYFLGADDDVFFPTDMCLMNMQRAFGGKLSDHSIITDCKHIPGQRHKAEISKKLIEWLEA